MKHGEGEAVNRDGVVILRRDSRTQEISSFSEGVLIITLGTESILVSVIGRNRWSQPVEITTTGGFIVNLSAYLGMRKTIQPEVETTDRVYHQIKEYANDRNIDMALAWGELVAAGLESKYDNEKKNLEASYRAFEQMNHEISDQWEGVSREATDLLGPAPVIEAEDGEVWKPESGDRE